MKKMMVLFLAAWMLVLGGCGETAAATAVEKEMEMEESAAEKQEDAAEKGNGGTGGENKADDGAAAEKEAVEKNAAEKEAAEGDKAGENTDGTTVPAESGATEKAMETNAEAAEKDGEGVQDKADADDSNEGTKGKETKDDKTADTQEMEAAAGEDAESVEEKQPRLADYEMTVYEQPEVMYASNPVNVRKGPTTDFERTGGLRRGQEVSVTGQADTGWYEIVYGDGKAYVSGHYLQKEKPEEEPAPQQQAAAQGQPVTEVKNVAGVIMVGDSRFVQMQANIGENSCTWIAENGKGYNWFNETAVARIDGCVGKGSKILINLGVNDPGHVNDYLALVNAKAAEWVGKGAKVYYASVNPVWENPYTTEEQVEYFNSQMQAGLSGDVRWIDSHSYLNSIGYKLVDGLHFNAETYQNLYAYFMSCL